MSALCPSDELVARMEALCRAMAGVADGSNSTAALPSGNSPYAEARAIVAELPKPVDPAILVCRTLHANSWREDGQTSHAADRYERGVNDDTASMKIAIAAYRAGQASC